jgi:hypothetical protein
MAFMTRATTLGAVMLMGYGLSSSGAGRLYDDAHRAERQRRRRERKRNA